MPNVDALAKIGLVITELEEVTFVLKLVRDDHPVEARQRIGGRIERCEPAPIVIVDPDPGPLPNPLPDCHEFRSLPPYDVLRAVEQLLGAQMLAVKRLCELYEAAGPSS